MLLDSCKALASRRRRRYLDRNGAAYLYREKVDAVNLVEDLKLELSGGDYPNTDSIRSLR